MGGGGGAVIVRKPTSHAISASHERKIKLQEISNT